MLSFGEPSLGPFHRQDTIACPSHQNHWFYVQHSLCVCRTMSNLCLDPKDAFLALIRRWSFTGPKRVVFSSPKMPIKCSLPRGLTGQARHTEFRKLKPVQSWFGRPSSGAKVSFELSVGCWIDWIVPSMLL